MPPSAMTVWALPSSDLHTRAVRAPAAEASTAARRPAPPAPTTTTSKSWLSYSAISASALEEPQVPDGAGGHQADVEVGGGDADHADPGDEHVPFVEPGHELPEAVPGRLLGQAVEAAPAD